MQSLLEYFTLTVQPLNKAYGDGASYGNGGKIKRGEGWRSAKRHRSGKLITDNYWMFNVAFSIFETTPPEAVADMISRLETDFDMCYFPICRSIVQLSSI